MPSAMGGSILVWHALFCPSNMPLLACPWTRAVSALRKALQHSGLLLSTENVSFDGQFHHFSNITSLPRAGEQPHPPLGVAALASEESFYKAGLDGYNLMAIPMSGAVMRPLLQTYRQAYRPAAHPGQGKVMLAFHMYCAPTDREAHDTARPLLNTYL